MAVSLKNNRIMVFEQTSSEKFKNRKLVHEIKEPVSVTADDIDNDGDIDLIIGTETTTGVYWIRQDSSKDTILEKFTEVLTVTEMVGRVRSLSIVDVNNDGNKYVCPHI